MFTVVICVGAIETKTPDVEATRIWMVEPHGTFQVGRQVLDRCGNASEPASSFRFVPFPAVFPHFLLLRDQKCPPLALLLPSDFCWKSRNRHAADFYRHTLVTSAPEEESSMRNVWLSVFLVTCFNNLLCTEASHYLCTSQRLNRSMSANLLTLA